MRERWRAIFKDPEALRVRERLEEGLRMYVEDNRVVLEADERDRCWKAAEWASHNAVPGRKLFYSVVGERLSEGFPKVIYVSWCPKCRRGEHEHGEG
jgi:ribonucleotide reductase alpha subunit